MAQTPIAPSTNRPRVTAGPSRGRRRTVVLGAGALIFLVAGAVVAWRVVAAQALDEVEVQVTRSECQGEDARTTSNGTGTTVRTAKDMRCVFTVDVDNGSERDVRVGEVRALLMGPDTGAVIRAESIDGALPHGDDSRIDATHHLDRSLPAGESTSFEIVVVFNPEGCNDSGTLRLDNFPEVEVSALGVDRITGGSRFLAFRNDIRTPGCKDLE